MRLQRWFSWLGVGTLVLSGMLMTGPLASAQDATTPAAQAADDDDGDNSKSVVGTPLLAPAIDLKRAQEIALEGRTGAVTDVELSGDNGVLAYSVALDSGVEVEINATSGEIIRTEEQDGERDEVSAEQNEDGDQNDNGGNEDEDQDANQQDDDDENEEDEA